VLNDLPFDWFILLLRVLFIFLLYFFLYQILRVSMRELIAIATANGGRPRYSRVAPSGRLLVVDGAESRIGPGTVFALEPVTTVGRHPECTVSIDEPFLSAEHAELTWDNGRWWVHDLGSTNGTFVNGQLVTVPTGIKAGDVVQFGRIRLQLAPGT
jgi:hypothetical protein